MSVTIYSNVIVVVALNFNNSFLLIYVRAGKFRIEIIQSKIIGVSWDARALEQGNVTNILLVADPISDSLSPSGTWAKSATGKASITDNLKPSTTYVIHIKDTGVGRFAYTLGEITTLPLGESMEAYLVALPIFRSFISA